MTALGEENQRNRHDPAEAFKAIGNETRLAILWELATVNERPISFTELRKRVGMRDGSQFNYHLNKLVPGFVERTDEGFHLSHAGDNVIQAIVAGNFIVHPTVSAFAVEGECVTCNGILHARFDHDQVVITCADCNQYHYMAVFPPGGQVGRTPEEVVEASDRKLRADYLVFMAGICPRCASRTDQTVLGRSDAVASSDLCIKLEAHFDDFPGPGVVYECEQCDALAFLTMGETLLFEPTVIEFFRDQGHTLAEIPLWTLPWCIPATSHEYTTVLTDDPLTVRVGIPLNDEVLWVTLDDTLSVVTAARTKRADSATKSDAE
ncbi:winged helix-turn-helix domain-containing protein [Haladaptatus sp. ZSTT2]|uniref:winged helix-turn-helix domain-containing protein n=1 Tax=Haladaptatus sp. ZSTT2 TaxID=3120515 RepID=UPI00300ED8D3